MSFELAFRSRVASIMETLTATALQDLCKLMEETCAALRVEIVHEQNQRTSRMNTNLQVKETSTETDTLTCTENIQIAGIPPELNNNFPVVGQILNEQEANGLWLNGYPTIESGPQSREPAREEPSQPLNQATQEVETWQAPLIKQEEMDDEDIKCQGYGEWTPEAYDANQNDTGESDATENSQASGGADGAAAPKKRACYTCEICGKTETQERLLASHMITHTGTPFSCALCGENFLFLKLLLQHQRSTHIAKTFKCSLCEKSFTKAGYRDNHERSHSGKNYRCSGCGESFKERGDRDAHKCVVHKGKQYFSCSECNENFERQYHLKRHQLEKHTLIVDLPADTKPKSKIFEGQLDKCQSDGKKVEKPYSCSVCCMEFVYRKFRDNHERKHSGKRTTKRTKNYFCSDCGKSFEKLGARKTHNCVIYKGEHSFRCSVCGRDFERQHNLKRHQLEKHPLMVEQTVNPEHAHCNARQNTGKSYSCLVCGKGFIYIKSLNKHELNHKQDTEHQEHGKHKSRVADHIKPQLKSRKFGSQQSKLKLAKTSEKPRKYKPVKYSCKICGATFLNKSGMAKHRSVDHYVCSVCGKGFRFKRLYHHHQLRHKNSNTWCLPCDKGFMSLYYLHKHQLEKHPVMVKQPSSELDSAAVVLGSQPSIGCDQEASMSDLGEGSTAKYE